jgi:hypothetical protein
MTRTVTSAPSSAPADWLRDGVRGFAVDVGSLIPARFDACARVFHPALGRDGSKITWEEVAAFNGRVFHPAAQWPAIAFVSDLTDVNDLQTPPPGAPWEAPPSEGSLDRDDAVTIGALLAVHTRSPEEILYAAWEGWGGLDDAIRSAPTFALPSRNYHLLTGALEAAAESVYADESWYQSFTYWWPSDRAWCLATEIDFDSTYVAGSEECIADVVGHPALEAERVAFTQGVGWRSDTINPNPMRI